VFTGTAKRWNYYPVAIAREITRKRTYGRRTGVCYSRIYRFARRKIVLFGLNSIRNDVYRLTARPNRFRRRNDLQTGTTARASRLFDNLARTIRRRPSVTTIDRARPRCRGRFEIKRDVLHEVRVSVRARLGQDRVVHDGPAAVRFSWRFRASFLNHSPKCNDELYKTRDTSRKQVSFSISIASVLLS